MATVQDQLHSRLTSSATLTALLVGGIYKRPLKRGDVDTAGRLVPPGATPLAFAGPHVRPSAVIVDRGEQSAALAPVDSAVMGFPEVWLYAAHTETGKQQLALAWEEAYSLLHRWRFAGASGTGFETLVVGRLGVMDDPALAAAIVDRMRLQVAGLWRNVN
ncbi:MAG TPA: hypothetical protein VH475_23175 [Tepidisphaeraceae bacterium]|jgi:hypothetical protein